MNKKTCLICGKEIDKKHTYCSKHCQIVAQHRNGCHVSPFKRKEVRDKAKLKIKEKYGVDNILKLKEFRDKGKTPEKIEQQKQHCKNTMLKRYGVEYNSQLPQIKKSISKKLHTREANDKRKRVFQEKYKTDNYFQSNEFKSLRNTWVEENKQKEYKTKKKNNSFNHSKCEMEILNKLKEKFNDVVYQYRSEKYPFNCDFYIPSLNLYIEYQGFWSHGKEPFDSNKIEHLEKIKKWQIKSQELNFKGENKKLYSSAIFIWTISDPLKRKIAKENNLNWIEFFNLTEFYSWFNNIKNKDIL